MGVVFGETGAAEGEVERGPQRAAVSDRGQVADGVERETSAAPEGEDAGAGGQEPHAAGGGPSEDCPRGTTTGQGQWLQAGHVPWTLRLGRVPWTLKTRNGFLGL